MYRFLLSFKSISRSKTFQMEQLRSWFKYNSVFISHTNIFSKIRRSKLYCSSDISTSYKLINSNKIPNTHLINKLRVHQHLIQIGILFNWNQLVFRSAFYIFAYFFTTFSPRKYEIALCIDQNIEFSESVWSCTSVKIVQTSWDDVLIRASNAGFFGLLSVFQATIYYESNRYYK